MTKPSSSLYRAEISGAGPKIREAIETGKEKSKTTPLVFFRADDIGYPSKQFTGMIESFKVAELPLCLATVPAWLNANRFKDLLRETGTSKQQWCWHQHGHVHKNFEMAGKKQEFGPARDALKISSSLEQGWKRLHNVCDDIWHPVFTPPWNRCSQETLQALKLLGFKAVSRSKGAKPVADELKDFQVNVDLHTRKENSPAMGFENLLVEIEEGLGSGLCGFMLHHQRMNRRSFEFLDILLTTLSQTDGLQFVHFGNLLEKETANTPKSRDQR